MFFGTMTV